MSSRYFWHSPTAGDIDREPDEELFGDDMGLIGCCVGNDCWFPGKPVCDTLFADGGGCCCWFVIAILEEFSLELFWAAAAASC